MIVRTRQGESASFARHRALETLVSKILPRGRSHALPASALAGGRGDSAGPAITDPSVANREPWHGQSQVRSAVFQVTRHPICVQTAGHSDSAPAASRYAA